MQPGRTPADRRIDFILASLAERDRALQKHGGGLILLKGDPIDCIPRVAAQLDADTVFANRDYEPAAIARDEAVARRLSETGRTLVTLKDQVIFEREKILSQQGRPYTVFTPYQRAWRARLSPSDAWFRIFNPVTQSKQYDPQGHFIKRYVPELERLPAKWIHAPWLAASEHLSEFGFVPGRDYPLPIVDHAKARAATLARYGAVGAKERP